MRSITDTEIGLIKAMLGRGTKNRDIQFYFNRPDRPVNSGRITQIRNGSYGPDVSPATDGSLDVFLRTQKITASTSDEIASLIARAANHFEKRGRAGWFLKTHETDEAECKTSFSLKPDIKIAPILRAIAGLANNGGGFIFLGVEELTDKSLKVVGLSTSSAFLTLDPRDINLLLVSTFDPVPAFSFAPLQVGGLTIGAIEVRNHSDAPIIALKNFGSDIREGGIYFRYVGETRAIKPGELRSIIAQRERRAVEQFAQSMNRVAKGVSATIDLHSGSVVGKSGSFTIDKNLLKQIQFLREGEFSETSGAPALKLIGEVTAIEGASSTHTRIVSQNLTSDTVLRTFLANKLVDEPLPYILSLAHANPEWLPIWFYVYQSGLEVSEIIKALKSEAASQPSRRDAALARLTDKKSAYKQNLGSPKKVLNDLMSETIAMPKDVLEDVRFALAIQGLPDKYKHAELVRPMLLSSLDRAMARDSKTSNRRSSIYRAACRIDELLYKNAKLPPK